MTKHSINTVLVLLLMTLMAACHKDDDRPMRDTRTVIVYIAAENSLYDYARMDVQEMLAGVGNIGDGDHLVIFLDDLNLPRIYVLDNKTTALTLANLTPTHTFDTELNSADAATLHQVLGYATSHCPATTYACVFWSHGSGWLFDSTVSSNMQPHSLPRRSFGIDNGQNTSSNRGHKMYISDMAQVLKDFPRMKFILFDACFMQTIEVAYELKDCADYIIGSPAEIPAYGAPYHQIMPSMFATQFTPGSLISAYANYYTAAYPFSVVLSAIKTDEIDNFASYMQSTLSSHTWLDRDYDNCLDYYLFDWNRQLSLANPMPDYYDIKGLMMQTLSDSELAEWQKEYDKMVVACYAPRSWWSAFASGGRGNTMAVDAAQCGGVSMYLPLAKYERYSFYADYHNTQWGKLFNIK